MALTAVAIKNARVKDKPYKLSDGEGLYLLVNPNGSRLWRFKYRFSGKEKVLAMGIYPAMSLADAREARTQARRYLLEKIDPSVVKKKERTDAKAAHADSFQSVAAEWFETMKGQWVSGYSLRIYRRLEEHLFPQLGIMQVKAIEPLHVLSALRKVEEKGLGETPLRMLQLCGAIFRYAVVTDRCKSDPSASLKGALKPRPRPKKRSALRVRPISSRWIA